MKINEIFETHSERLDELIGFKKATNYYGFKDDLSKLPKNWTAFQGYILERFVRSLNTLGYKFISNGQFGIVFTKPGLDYVVKIFRSDPAFLHFVDYVQRNKSDPHLPKFRGKPVRIDDQTVFLRIELLEKFDDDSVFMDVVDFAKQYADSFYHDVPDDVDDYIDDEARHFFGTIYREAIPKLEHNAGLLTTMLKIGENVPDGTHLDLHGGNFMMRGNTIVVTDPFCIDNFTELDKTVLSASKNK